jgi:hypothetical protein
MSMRTLRQVIRSTCENGGSVATFCRAKMHMSRIALVTRQLSSSF